MCPLRMSFFEKIMRRATPQASRGERHFNSARSATCRGGARSPWRTPVPLLRRLSMTGHVKMQVGYTAKVAMRGHGGWNGPEAVDKFHFVHKSAKVHS